MHGKQNRFYLRLWSMLMIWSVLGTVVSQAQEGDRIAERLLNNVVQLTVSFSDGSTEHGFGFVVGARGNSLYLVTANHVVREEQEPDIITQAVHVRFYADRGKTYPATLLELAYREVDLALLEIDRPWEDYSLEPCSIYTTPTRGERVWFIGRSQEWWVPPDQAVGSVIVPPSIVTIQFPVYMPSVLPGTSGAPVFSAQGIVGMMIEDSSEEATVLSIAAIKDIMVEKWGYSWTLDDAAPSSLSQPQPIPGIGPKRLAAALRSEPCIVSQPDAQDVFRLDEQWKPRTYIANSFEAHGTVVLDRANGLMWQQSGSAKKLTTDQALTYIADLNRERFGGYADWRLPTIDELISLLESDEQAHNLYIDPLFDATQVWIWSSDRSPWDLTCSVHFGYGVAGWYVGDMTHGYVRAVRSMTEEESPSAIPAGYLPTTSQADNEWTDPITGMEFVWIEGGCFQMGQTQQEQQELIWELKPDGYEEWYEKRGVRTLHEVCVDGFWMGKYEVTNAQYRQWDDSHDSGNVEGVSLNGDGQPVVNVSWYDVQAFNAWLGRNLDNAYTFRLPTEAEWEYAARAGTTTRYFWGDQLDDICQYENVADQAAKHQWPDEKKYNIVYYACNDGYVATAPVGMLRPNPFGLYDMLGNVFEWCQDWYDAAYYDQSPRNNPQGPSTGEKRVARGGSWLYYPFLSRPSFRESVVPDEKVNSLRGFRVVRMP